MNALAIRNTGGTDHLSYDAVGLPGFQFIQDPVEYNSRTHHSNMDVYERVQAADMMKNYRASRCRSPNRPITTAGRSSSRPRNSHRGSGHSILASPQGA